MHYIAVGRCPTGDEVVWRCDVCGNDDGGEESWVTTCPFDAEGPVCQ